FKHYFIKRPLKLLDVGCGYGPFLDFIKYKLPNVKRCGVDLNEDILIRYLKKQGHSYYQGKFENVNFKGKFDIVTMLEFLDPNTVLKKVNLLLNNKGMLVIEVPNFKYHLMKGKIEKSRLYQKIFKYPEYGLMPHVHFNYFTSKSLTKMLNNQGFKVIKIFTREITFNADNEYSKILIYLSRIYNNIALVLSRMNIYVGSAFILIAIKK
ncbi:class I SAM-dependent methyltransferase, partial [Nanoarchaeota archaeon]